MQKESGNGAVVAILVVQGKVTAVTVLTITGNIESFQVVCSHRKLRRLTTDL
jgi:hypothetical protein